MSFLIATPGTVAAAATDLARLGSSLREAAAAAAQSTAGVRAAAADEVSAAISQLFGGYGREFQAQSARAAAFHAEFVSLIDGSAAAYLGTEITNSAASGLDTVLPLPIVGGSGGGLLGSLLGGGSGGVSFPSFPAISISPPGLQQELNALFPGLFSGLLPPATPNPGGSPWVTLVDNTGANLQATLGTWIANPFPALKQFVINQVGYADLVGTAFANAVTNFPGGLQVLPGQFQAALQAAEGFNPGGFLHWYATNQAAYSQIENAALQKAIQDLQATIPTFEADLGGGYHALSTGDFHGAVRAIPQAFVDLFLSGVEIRDLSDIEIHGPAGDLIPYMNAVAQQNQTNVNLLPQGSTVQHMLQNFYNAENALGEPLGLALIGPPIATLDGLATGAEALGAAVQSGNPVAVAGALLDMPAYALNGYLNGDVIVDLTVPVSETVVIPAVAPLTNSITIASGTPVVVHMPFTGILTQPQPITATVEVDATVYDIPVANIGLSDPQAAGLIPTMLTYLPEQVAAAISPGFSGSTGFSL